MFYRHILKTFTNPRSIYLLKNSGAPVFGNYKSFIPLSTTRPCLKEDKPRASTGDRENKRIQWEFLQPPIEGLIKVTFHLYDGRTLQAEGKVGDTLLDVVVNNDLDIDGYGACEGTVTCSTCHVVLKKEDYDRIPDEVTDEERDMLDLAYGLTDTSRLGCQITLTKEMDGLEIKVPESVHDARS